MPPRVRLAQLLLVEGADPEEQLELVAEVRPHHLRPVRRDREGDLVLDERADRLADGVLVRKRLREQVRGRADLEHDPERADRGHQLRVGGREDPVPDAIRSQALDDLGDLVAPDVAALLADVDRDAEPRLAGELDHRLDLRVVVGLAAGTRPRDVHSDDSAARPAHGLLDDDLVEPDVEGAIHHQDQPGAHLRVLDARAIDAADRGEDDVVEVALASAVSLHRVEPQLERRDPLRAIGATDGAVHRALDRDRRRLDDLRPVVDLVELVEPLHPVRVGHRDERVELPVVLHRERDPLLVGDRPEDVGGDRASEMGVQLGEPFAREDHRGSLGQPVTSTDEEETCSSTVTRSHFWSRPTAAVPSSTTTRRPGCRTRT